MTRYLYIKTKKNNFLRNDIIFENYESYLLDKGFKNIIHEEYNDTNELIYIYIYIY